MRNECEEVNKGKTATRMGVTLAVANVNYGTREVISHSVAVLEIWLIAMEHIATTQNLLQ